MPPIQHATTKAKRIRRTQSRTDLRLVTSGDVAQPTRCLLLQGTGHPDCPEFYGAVEAIDGVVQLLRSALDRSGRSASQLGAVEKSWTFRREEQLWQWKVRALVPASVTASAVELAKHLIGQTWATEPIALVPVCGYTIH